MALVGQGCAWITALGLPGRPLTAVATIKLGVVYLTSFVGGALRWSVSTFDASGTVRIPLAAGTIVVLVLGYRQGRAGRRLGEVFAASAVFSALCFALAFVGASAPLVASAGSTPVTMTPIAVSAGVGAGLLFLMAGLVGSVERDARPGSMLGAAWRMIAVGGVVTMLLMVLVLPAQPGYSDTAFAGFRLLGEGQPGSVAGALNNALAYPTEGAWVMAAATGGCISGGLGATVKTVGTTVCGTDLFRGSRETEGSLPGGLHLPSMPPSYGWLPFGPAVGALFGGAWLVRRRSAGNRSERSAGTSALPGLGAGCLAGMGLAMVAWWTRIQLDGSAGMLGAGHIRVGPSFWGVVLPAAVVAAVFGGLGAVLARLISARRPDVPAEASSPG